MKNIKEVQAILTAIFAINRTSEHEDKDITLILDYAFNRLFGSNTNLLILACAGKKKKKLCWKSSSSYRSILKNIKRRYPTMYDWNTLIKDNPAVTGGVTHKDVEIVTNKDILNIRKSLKGDFGVGIDSALEKTMVYILKPLLITGS